MDLCRDSPMDSHIWPAWNRSNMLYYLGVKRCSSLQDWVLLVPPSNPFASSCDLCSRAGHRECDLGLPGALNYILEQLSRGTHSYELCHRGRNSLQEGGFWNSSGSYCPVQVWSIRTQMWGCAFTFHREACTAESFSIRRKPWSCRKTPV